MITWHPSIISKTKTSQIKRFKNQNDYMTYQYINDGKA